MTTFKQHFKIPSTETVEFQDIPLIEDLTAFIDPFLIANNRDVKIFNDVYVALKAFFTKLNREFVLTNDRSNGLEFLDKLHEPNEYHLGYSATNKGAAISDTRAETVFDALRNNRFVRGDVSITNEAHNILLLVSGIGQDIMSDTIANVCRGIFADFTKEQCRKYSIATESFKRYFFNPKTQNWEIGDFELPTFNGKCIVLVPKKGASSLRSYVNHYNYFVAKNRIAADILNGKISDTGNNKFIRTLKNGDREAIIKKIYKAYRKPKEELVDFVITYSGTLEEFLDYAKENYPAIDLSDL